MRFLRIVNRRFKTNVVFLALALFAHAYAWGGSVVDVTGQRVQLKDKPMRIVTLVPSLGELVADLVGDEMKRIVGVSEYSDFPVALKKIKSIGPYHQFSLEKVMALKPDLVLATSDGNPKDRVLHLRELDIPVVVVNTSTMEQVFESMQIVSAAVGAQERGAKMLAQLKSGIDRIKSRTRVGAVPSVLLQVGVDPLVAVGRQSFLHEALESVGAKNIYGDTSATYPRPSMEDVIQRNPDMILIIALGEDMKPYEQMLARWQQFPSLKAVREKKVSVLQGDPILRPTLRLLEGLAILEKTIHGAQPSK